ncbi:MAG TPA: putative ABC exporter domain-containing protein [Gemmatimonadales bacterium]|jgi:hypothetical protein
MRGAAAALRYLIGQSTVNRLRQQAVRVRQPRYAIATLVAVAYVVLVVMAPRPDRPVTALSPTVLTLGATAIAGYLLSMWLVRTGASGLAFTPAEVQFLFTGPLTTRELVAYRVARSQIVILLSALIWSWLLRSFAGATPPLLRFVSAWGLVTVLSLHGLAVDLMRNPPVQRVRMVVLRTMQLVAVGVIAIVVAALLPLLRQGASIELSALASAGETALTHGAAGVVLRPFVWLLAPFARTTVATWMAPFGVVLAVIAGHLAWVLLPSTDIVDQAGAASAKAATRRARILSQRTSAVIVTQKKASRTWLPLAPTGLPALAIAWKNTLALVRSALSTHISMVVLVVVMLVQLRGGDPTHVSHLLRYVAVSAVLVFFGPRTIRADLRQDLPHLAQLRTYPLTGASLVAGEIAVPTIILSLAQLLILGFGVVMTWNAIVTAADGAVTAALLLVVGAAVVLALNAMNVAIQNALALLFPGWVRLGGGAAGIEAMGQTLIVTLGSIVVLLLTMILPVIAAVVVDIGAAATLHSLPIVAGAAGAAVGTAILGMEVVGLVHYLGRVFDRTDPA